MICYFLVFFPANIFGFDGKFESFEFFTIFIYSLVYSNYLSVINQFFCFDILFILLVLLFRKLSLYFNFKHVTN